jgi:hypothetical protein
MKSNKLIAEFMGYEVNHNKCYSPKYNDGTIAPMQFHKSWDWLMPVVKKIEDYLSDNVGKVGYFDECLSSNDLNTRYQAVVEFIKNLKTIQYEN